MPMNRYAAPQWTPAHEAALERAKAQAAEPPPVDEGPPLTRMQIAQRDRRAREDAKNPPSAEVFARRAYKAKSRALARAEGEPTR